jgi:hypothetical protein
VQHSLTGYKFAPMRPTNIILLCLTPGNFYPSSERADAQSVKFKVCAMSQSLIKHVHERYERHPSHLKQHL